MKFAKSEKRKEMSSETPRIPNDLAAKTKEFAEALGPKSVRCKNSTCRENMSARRLVYGREYCRKCTRVCKDETCEAVFTPDHAGTGVWDGFCGDCATCRDCQEKMCDFVCECCV